MDKLQRTSQIKRSTSETDIEVQLNLDGSGSYDISTGIGFLDHMIEQLSKHSLIDIKLRAKGDLHIDCHHTTEDCGIAIGMALREALGDKIGITRYGHTYIPMDEAMSRVAVDISGRPFLVWNVDFTGQSLGEMDTELFEEWFIAFAHAARITLHVQNLYGKNQHHIIESVFKALARALRTALTIDPRASGQLPSTKGAL